MAQAVAETSHAMSQSSTVCAPAPIQRQFKPHVQSAAGRAALAAAPLTDALSFRRFNSAKYLCPLRQPPQPVRGNRIIRRGNWCIAEIAHCFCEENRSVLRISPQKNCNRFMMVSRSGTRQLRFHREKLVFPLTSIFRFPYCSPRNGKLASSHPLT